MQPEEILAKQFRFLRYLKRLKPRKLRRYHRKIFPKVHPYWIRIPRWIHRTVLERRLFYYFCLKNYHYPQDHYIYRQFKQNAKHVLSQTYIKDLDPTEQAKQVTKEYMSFTPTRIKSMSIVEVDRYLASLSLFVEADEDTRRKVLWEWFNKPGDELTAHFNRRGLMVRKKGPVNNKYRLRELILENPMLQYDGFVEAFGEQMPTVSRASFNNARSQLKKAGYELPILPRGPYKPVVATGKHGKLSKARQIVDATPTGIDNGKEEPF